MSKLFKLKEWLTIEETAQHLSGVLGESVEEKNIYRLALDGHLQLSVNFVNDTNVNLGEIVNIRNAQSKPQVYNKDVLSLSTKIDDKCCLYFKGDVTSIYGVWDLMMIGWEWIDIEKLYQQETNGPEVNLEVFEGTLVQQGNTIAKIVESIDNNPFKLGSLARLQNIKKDIKQRKLIKIEANLLFKKHRLQRDAYLEKRAFQLYEDDFHPTYSLPKDSVLVVKTKAIIDFINTVDKNQEEKPKPLKSKERNTLLILIGALCNDAKIDYNGRGIAVSLEKMTEILGAPVTDDTIRNILKQIDDAVSLRSK